MSTTFVILDKFKDALLRITPYVEKYKNEKNIELEFRLGFIEVEATLPLRSTSGVEATLPLRSTSGVEATLSGVKATHAAKPSTPYFNTDIPVEFFNKITNKLNSNKNWAAVKKSKNTDYFNSGYRISVIDNKPVACIKKTKLVTINFRFEDTPFDIRFCISKEEPCVLNDVEKRIKNSNHSREKQRTRFTHKYWNFDVTKVKEIENTVENITHEIELDVSWPTEAPIDYVIYSSLLKMNDLANMCENVSEESKMVFVSAKSDEKK